MSSKPCYYHDSHCHLLQFKNIDNVIKEASAHNVTKIVAVSMYKDENFEVLKLAQKYPNIIIPALGVHPIVISKKTDIIELFNEIAELIKKNIAKIKFIGEIGLDRYFSKDKDIFNKQKQIFEKFLGIAEKYKLNVSIHGKNAENEVLEILRSFKIKTKIFHWLSVNDSKIIKKAIEDGFHFSVNFSIKYSKKVQNLVKNAPLNKLLYESDGPYKYKGGTQGTPILIPMIAKDISNLKKLNTDEICRSLQKNFENIL